MRNLHFIYTVVVLFAAVFIFTPNNTDVINGAEVNPKELAISREIVPEEVPRSVKDALPFRPLEMAPYEWVGKTKIIAHGMGGVDRKRVTNSLTAFKYNYKNGIRVFEADFVFTTDNHLVARHDWHEYMYKFLGQENKGQKLSLKEFKSLKIHGGWESLSIYDIMDLMKKYPDIYLVLDTKIDYLKVVAEIVTQFSKEDRSLLQRVIPQVYDPEGYYKIKELYPFENIIFTLYKTSMTEANTLAFIDKNHINVLTISISRAKKSFIQRLKAKGVAVYVHTVNNKEEAKSLLTNGASGIYTDFLSLSDLK